MSEGAAWYYGVQGTRNGPITWEALAALAREGRVRGGDLVWTAGMADWQPASTVSGLIPVPVAPAAAVHPGAASFPPPPLTTVRLGGADDPMMRMLLPVGRSSWAIAAGYLGLFSFLVLPGPLALGAGILAVRDIRKNSHLHGMGRAIFGIVMGGLATLGLIGIAAALLMEGG
jgi:hypothetical protein